MDSQHHPVPAGIPGEIYIGGAGVALGYLNHDTLTKERFLPHDFAPREYTLYNWTTMHKSGHHGYFVLDGHLFLDGRIDDDAQIKLPGIRIDRRAIESTIVQQPTEQFRTLLFLFMALMDMQPAVVTMLDQSPTNYSGKVDGKAISELQSHPREAFSRIMPQRLSGEVKRNMVTSTG
ncbi:hypothetical protein MAA_11567 [Metarhizium robertsii ARSEF 23]|uniref:Uncharacterized protein n=1 Tax=Metarhizium robertsii (strain ARSEF 23 / ATCC MYA-3075) TaxID=655844 RepID=A0A0B2XFU3_METRA|nr:uncharacterized protein MAA_11567 [Metarhizium robertsii ARSEF 23]KHO10806.1 hypothetical protein MAA_11567 [Metarhizium robertsii ARSEF 23]